MYTSILYCIFPHSYDNVNSTNSKQSKLCVKCTLYIDTRLFWKHAVRRNRPQYVYDEIVKASVSGMLHLRNVFQFVVYRLYNSPFPKPQFVRHTHQSPLHRQQTCVGRGSCRYSPCLQPTFRR